MNYAYYVYLYIHVGHISADTNVLISLVVSVPLVLPLSLPLPVLIIEIYEQKALLPLTIWISMVMDVFPKPRPS